MALLAAFGFLSVAITKKLAPDFQETKIDMSGPIAEQTIIAEIGFKSIDKAATHAAAEAAAAQVPDVFVVSRAAVNGALARLDQLVGRIQAQRPGVEAAVRNALAQNKEQAPSTVVAQAVRAYAEKFAQEDDVLKQVSKPQVLAVWLTPKPDWISAMATPASSGADANVPEPPAFEFAFEPELTTLARQGLDYVLASGIRNPAEPRSGSSPDPQRRIRILREEPIRDLRPEELTTLSQTLTMATAAEQLNVIVGRLASELDVGASGSVDRVGLQDAAVEIARLCLAPTLAFDAARTDSMREAARISVEPVMREFMRSEEIVRQGERWTEQNMHDVSTYLAELRRYDKDTANVIGTLIGHMVLVGLILIAFTRALPGLVSDEAHLLRDLLLSLLIMCGSMAAARGVAYIDKTGLLAPLAAGAILLAILSNPRVAVGAAILNAVMLSAMYDYDWRLLVVSLAMAAGGALSIHRVRKRSDMGSAAVKATFAGVVIAAGIALAEDELFTEATVRSLALIAGNGIVCLFLVPGLLSQLERLFGIVTDIQLLEYSDLNNPILRRLAMEVPATYAHSLMLGQLAEAACDAIGANGLLARVCAYYHDIGKLKRPEYFAENQTGVNIHDGMSPRLSARAIASHVSEGAEMARELHLPKPIIDAIYEHHGTCLISFFYQQAVAQQKHGGISERDFRYGGPRPRSRETAVLMICDAVESAVRTLKNPNEERIREMIDRIISSRQADRQFDECDLTMRDLDTIAEVLTHRIGSSQHRRIVYPGQPGAQAAANVIPMAGSQEN